MSNNTPVLRPGRARVEGLSLIELLVAVAISGILMGGAISLFVSNRATYEITNDMARLQENARFALQSMTEDIRMAAHVGCINDFTKVNDNTGLAEGQLGSFAHAIEGYESGAATWAPSGHAGEDDAIIAGDGATYGAFMADSDGITVRYLDGNRDKTGTDVDNEVINESPDDANATNTTIFVRNLNFTMQEDQLAGISDCGAADVFSLTADPGVDGATGADTIPANALQRSYEILNRALVAPAVAVRYFVRLNGAGVPALFRTTVDAADPANEVTQELVDGVQSLQLLYGVDSDQDGQPNAFLSPGDSIPDPADATRTVELLDRNDFLSVVAVKIAMLMVTVDEFGNVPEDLVYDVGEERFCRTGLVAAPVCTRTYPQDRRRRRVFQSTVAVRNFQ